MLFAALMILSVQMQIQSQADFVLDYILALAETRLMEYQTGGA